MRSFWITVALIWAIAAIPAKKCTDIYNKVASSLAWEGVGLADISRICEKICKGIIDQSGTPCGEALLASPPEHLALPTYRK